MEKKIPKVFQNNIDKDVSNNDKYYYSANNNKNIERNLNGELKNKNKSINKKINEIFSSPTYVYKANVEITTKDSSFTTKIIGRNKNYLITMDNKTIPIVDIVDINMK